MRIKAMILCAAALLGGVALVHADGYVVILKGGHKIACREPMKIDGNTALITLVTGTLTSYPLDQVDIVETERYNQLGLGSALLIEELSMTGAPVATPTPRVPLGQYTSIDASGRNPELGSTSPPTPTPTPGIKLQTIPYPDERVAAAFARVFDQSKLYIYRTSAGSKPGYFFVQAVTDSQREVFSALRIVADAYTLIRHLHPEMAPTAVELEMIQTSGKAAGTFRLTPEMAAELADSSTSVEQFYVNYVIF